MTESSMFEIEGAGKSQSWLVVEPDGRITLLCGDDYYNGTMSLKDSVALVRAVLLATKAVVSLLPQSGDHSNG
jgi:hypothetical protein